MASRDDLVAIVESPGIASEVSTEIFLMTLTAAIQSARMRSRNMALDAVEIGHKRPTEDLPKDCDELKADLEYHQKRWVLLQHRLDNCNAREGGCPKGEEKVLLTLIATEFTLMIQAEEALDCRICACT